MCLDQPVLGLLLCFKRTKRLSKQNYTYTGRLRMNGWMDNIFRCLPNSEFVCLAMSPTEGEESFVKGPSESWGVRKVA